MYRLLISTKKNTVVYIIYNLLYSPFIIFKIWFWTSTRCQFLWERRWGRRSERPSLNSTTIRTRRNWLTGSPSYALSQILAGSSPNRTPWIRMVLLHTLQQMHYSVFPICLIILFNGVCLCVPVIITTQSPPSSFSSLWSRFSHSVRNRQVLLCPASSLRCPECLSAPHKPHPSLSAHPAPDSPHIRPKKPCIPFSKRLSPPYGYHVIPTLDPEEETTSGNMTIDSPVL